MTWQRIDENTYIDDTLITRAEYQLFIDEMRQQGMFYQPDHWKTNVVPNGKSIEQGIGVRLSDAIAFCNWLTLGDGNNWSYRLPHKAEIALGKIKYVGEESILGYWVQSEKQSFQFVWVSSIPKDARCLNQRLVLSRARNRSQKIIPLLGKSINRRASQALNLEHVEGTNEMLRINRELLVGRFNHANIVRSFLLSELIELTLSEAHDDEILRYSDLYIDFVTLQERIAGRSPAFEGIRLVKERIK